MAVAGNQITDAAPMHHLASPVDLTDLCFVETLQNILITMSYTTPAHGFATPPTMPAPRLTGGTGPEILTYSGGLTTCAITTEYVATFTQPEFTLNDVIDTFSWVFTAPNGSSIQLPRLVS